MLLDGWLIVVHCVFAEFFFFLLFDCIVAVVFSVRIFLLTCFVVQLYVLYDVVFFIDFSCSCLFFVCLWMEMQRFD